jgi:selenocysteine lyase/cysteine desulfurase
VGAGLGAALLAGCDSDDSAPPAATASGPPSAPPSDQASVQPSEPDFDPQDWDSVRAQFNLDPALAEFAAFVLSPHTTILDAAIAGYRDRLGTDTETTLNSSYGLEDAVRQSAATYAGGRRTDYALTDSTTMGIATMYGGLTLEPGDEVLTTTHDFYSTEESIRLLAERTGANVKRVSLYDDPAAASVDEIVSRLLAGITPRTRVVGVTWVHSSTGVRLPIQEISAALDALERVPRDQYVFCVDGVHGFSAVDVDLPDLGCDFLAAGTHKWLFGPRGTGILWGRDWTPLRELIPSFTGTHDGQERLTAGGFHTFEHRWAAADAFDLMGRIGRDRVVARTVEQATRLKEGLAGLDGITLITPTDPALSAGIVCLDVRDMLPTNAVQTLRGRDVVASATPYRVSYLRLGPSIVTSPEQVDAALDAVAALV